MRIVHIIPSIEGGGAENQLRLLANTMAGQGGDVWVIYLHANPNAHHLLNSNVNSICLNVTNNYSPGIFWALYNHLKRLSPDIVQTWITQVDIIVGLLSTVLKFKWIIREPSDKLSRKQNTKLKLRKKIAVWRGAVIVGNSERGLRYWEETGLQLQLIRNGYEIDFFKGDESAERKYHKHEIVCVGRLEVSKNLTQLMDVFESLPPDIKEGLHLTIIGKGPLAEALQQKAVLCNYKISFTGFINDKYELLKYYKKSNVYCSFSTNEGMPNTLIEAGLSGLLIIASDIPAHIELLPPDYPFLLPLADNTQMAQAITKALSLSDAERFNYVKEIQDCFAAYAITEVSAKYTTLYNSVVYGNK
ncbi:glycosyltransferase [Mucilaginibacter sp. 14171R-50]|uniref:glycosyltransferase n=1 Tax=Mucilaginibacter sp. 14171R-50 TaxID=2703789 RepID=UPI00138C4D07|nr:glycosyltransferase [Mucilaginibacter sp. 14171R-50]QHS54270.1 glycosyltransferase [Mucilaginibacter sp. 14171R-50]